MNGRNAVSLKGGRSKDLKDDNNQASEGKQAAEKGAGGQSWSVENKIYLMRLAESLIKKDAFSTAQHCSGILRFARKTMSAKCGL